MVKNEPIKLDDLKNFPETITCEVAKQWIKDGKANPLSGLEEGDKRALSILFIGRGLDDYYGKRNGSYDRIIRTGPYSHARAKDITKT
jgi:hypothetical protein